MLRFIHYIHIRGSLEIFSRHVIKRRSDWPELFGMASQGISPDHPFRGHFVSGNGIGTRLTITISSHLWVIYLTPFVYRDYGNALHNACVVGMVRPVHRGRIANPTA